MQVILSFGRFQYNRLAIGETIPFALYYFGMQSPAYFNMRIIQTSNGMHAPCPYFADLNIIETAGSIWNALNSCHQE